MKQIHPIQIWKNGALATATHLSLSIVNDNLQDIAVFLFRLCRINGTGDEQTIEVITEGNKEIQGQEYQNWGISEPANEEAYQIIANKLNLQLQ